MGWNAILDEVHRLAATDATIAALVGGRIYRGWRQRTDVPGIPYLVYRDASGNTTHLTTSAAHVNLITVRFQCFGLTASDCGSIIEAIQALFSGRTGAGAGFDASACVILGETGSLSVVEEPERDERGRTVWQGVVDIDFTYSA
jgi:hypothetical protein